MKELRGKPPRRLFELDLLRFFAAMAVVAGHFTSSGYVAGKIPFGFNGLGHFTRYGYLGVDLFFIISGFVVLMSAWGKTLRQFLASRIARLYPAYIVGVLVTSAVANAFYSPGRLKVGPKELLLNLTMFPGALDTRLVEAVYWTLWSEWRFYLLLSAFIVVGITLKKLKMAMIIWLVASAVSSAFDPPQLNRLWDIVVQPDYAQYFICGMCLYLIWSGKDVFLSHAIYVCSSALAIARAHDLSESQSLTQGTHYNANIASGIVAAILVVMLLVAHGGLRKLTVSWFSRLGELTYPLYLIHASIGYLLLNRLEPKIGAWMSLVVAVAAVVMLAWLIAKFVERPVQPRLRRLVLNGFKSKPVKTAAAELPE